jgi:hypothetical protein
MDTVQNFKDSSLTKKTKKQIYDNSLDTFLQAIRKHTQLNITRRRKYDNIYYLQGGILQIFLKIYTSTGDIYYNGNPIANIFMSPSEIFSNI